MALVRLPVKSRRGKTLYTIPIPIDRLKEHRIQLWELETLYLEAVRARRIHRVIEIGTSERFQIKRNDSQYLTYLWIHSNRGIRD